MPPMYPMGLLEFHQHGWHVLQQIQGLEGEETLMAQRFCASVVTCGHGRSRFSIRLPISFDAHRQKQT